MNTKITSIVLLLGVMLFDVSYAQNQTFGFYESDDVLAEIPEYDGVKQQLDLLSTGWKEEVRRLEKKIAEMEEDFKAKEILYTEEIRNQKKQEITQVKNQKDTYLAQKFGPDGEYFSRQRELLEPIQRQVFTAVRAVAQRKNLDFVFDRSGDIYMVYARNEWDITNDILTELGIEIDED
ncbi:MAG: OmpH family outer membrane protein [Balneolaceae bacterium]